MNIEQVIEHWDAIRAKHPDAMQIAKSDDFIGWLERQSAVVKTAAETGIAEDVILVLDRYKVAVGLTRKRPKFTIAQIERMSVEEFQRREKEIDEAMKAGNIV